MNSLIRKILLSVLTITSITIAGCNSGGGSSGGSSGGGTTTMFSIGGTISGLESSATVTLKDNGSNQLSISQNGNFTFSESTAKDGNYNVTVAQQPTGETCTVVDGSGYYIVSNVSNIRVICSEQTFTISGALQGLYPGEQVTINNNGDNPLTLGQNGNFIFSVPVAYASSYNVTVTSYPKGQACAVTNYENKAPVTANINNITVTCSDKSYLIGGIVKGLLPGQQVTLLNNGSDPTQVSRNGTFIFSQKIPYTGSYKVKVGTPPTNESCSASSNKGTVSSNVNNVIVNCNAKNYSISVNISGIANNDQVIVENNGGDYNVLYGTGSILNVVYSAIPYQSDYAISAEADGYSCTNASGEDISSNITVNINCTQHYFSIYSFQGTTYPNINDGANPGGGLVFANSYLYGTTESGGAYNNGTIYQINPSTGIESVVYSFQGYAANDGANPSGGLILATNGNLYGTTQNGGVCVPDNGCNLVGNGAIFSFNPNTNIESIIYSFSPPAYAPSSLIEASNGRLYGAVEDYYGQVFGVNLDGSNYAVLHQFSDQNDGFFPIACPIEGSDGKLYGITRNGGANNVGLGGNGTIYSLDKSGANYKILYTFSGESGAIPGSPLLEYSNGVFYGTTEYDSSTNNYGTNSGSGSGLVYKYDINNGYSVVYQFQNNIYAISIGLNGLTKGNDGNLYGSAEYGVLSSNGLIYQINPLTQQETWLYSFPGPGTSPDGALPVGRLVQTSDGAFWGATQYGGNGVYTSSLGTVFKYVP